MAHAAKTNKLLRAACSIIGSRKVRFKRKDARQHMLSTYSTKSDRAGAKDGEPAARLEDGGDASARRSSLEIEARREKKAQRFQARAHMGGDEESARWRTSTIVRNDVDPCSISEKREPSRWPAHANVDASTPTD